MVFIIDHLLDFFDIWFKKQLSFQRLLNKKSKLMEKLNTYLFWLFFFSILIVQTFDLKSLRDIVIVESFVWVILVFFKMFNKLMTSLRYFLAYGWLAEIVLSLIIYSLLVDGDPSANNAVYGIWHYVLFIFVLAATWSFLSCLANHKVSTLTNAILSTIFLLLDYILKSITNFLEYGDNIQKIHFYISMPFLITNVTAALACTLKGYWVDKYNEGKDITMELISE